MAVSCQQPIVFGDVETNPGPLEDITTCIEPILSTVDDTTFDEDDWNIVIKECSSLAAKWENVSGCLGLSLRLIDDIKGSFPGDLAGCWNEALKYWIKQNYKTEKFSLPSWRTLLKAVAGVDKCLFKKLADTHQAVGKSVSFATSSETNGQMESSQLGEEAAQYMTKYTLVEEVKEGVAGFSRSTRVSFEADTEEARGHRSVRHLVAFRSEWMRQFRSANINKIDILQALNSRRGEISSNLSGCQSSPSLPQTFTNSNVTVLEQQELVERNSVVVKVEIASSPMDIHVTLTFDFEEGGRITLDPQCPVGASTNAS